MKANMAIALAVATVTSSAVAAGALPGGGHFVSGHGAISKSGSTLAIDQASRIGIVNWNSFSIGKKNRVEFDNGSGATLNRVTGGNLSRIAGQIQSTGSVYVINRAGVLFTGTGRINTQGNFVASSRNADDDAFSDDEGLRLRGAAKGNVINRGVIRSNASVTLYGAITRAGTIDARNSVETSGDAVHLAGASITAKNWLVDPKNLKVTSASAQTIDASLNKGTNVTLKTTATDASGPGIVSKGAGDITIASDIAWKGDATLTLAAHRNVKIDANITAKGAGKFAITTNYKSGTGGDLLFGADDSITFDKLASTLKINGNHYTLESSIGGLASAMASQPTGRYALTKDIDLGGKTYTSSLLSADSTFAGTFEGLGHTISNLTIIDTADIVVGLFGDVATGATLRDIGLTNASVTGLREGVYGGVLVGAAQPGTLIKGAHATGVVVCGRDAECGGLAGLAQNIANSYASADVEGSQYSEDMGGLVGEADGNISNSYANGDVTVGAGSSTSGGLVGYAKGSISNSYATGNIVAGDLSELGGLVGYGAGAISNSYATGDVHGGVESYLGGLAGYADGITISGSHALGNVAGANASAEDDSDAGGLVGRQSGGLIETSYAAGAVSLGSADPNSTNYAGGLVGFLTGNGQVTQSHASNAVSAGTNSDVGGLFGFADAGTSIKHSYAAGNVNSGGGYNTESSSAGGLGGENEGTVSLSYATGNVTDGNISTTEFEAVGGLIGYESGGSVDRSFATGDVVLADHGGVGGLVGWIASGSVTNTYATGAVTCGGSDECYVGGLEGYDYGSLSDSYATGHVTGPDSSFVGGVTGTAGSGTSSNNYWDTTTTGVLAGTGSGGALNAAGYTTKQFRAKTLTDLGFDPSVWAQTTGVNGGLPYLKKNAPP